MERKPLRKSSLIIPLGTAVSILFLLAIINGRILMNNRVFKDTIGYLDQEIHTLKGFLDSFSLKKDQVIPIPMSELSQLIDEITRLGTDKNIDFIAIQSQKPRHFKKDIYQRMPLTISVRSDFKELSDFLGALRSLQTTTIIITQFKLERDEQSPQLVRGDILGEVLIENAE